MSQLESCFEDSIAKDQPQALQEVEASVESRRAPKKQDPAAVYEKKDDTLTGVGERYSVQSTDTRTDDSDYKKSISASHRSTPKRRSSVQDDNKIPNDVLINADTIIRNCLQDNPNAIGVVLLVHNEAAHSDIKDLKPLRGIKNGTDRLENCFANLGLAVIRLENPSRMLFKAVIKILSSPDVQHVHTQPSIRYPSSYRYFFLYTTGHGANQVFFTKDGSISYKEIVCSFQDNKSFEQKYFFFDCCRSVRLDKQSLYPNGDFDLRPGNRIVFATTSGCDAYGPGKGVSSMTKVMIELLPLPISLDELIRRLHEKLPSEIKEQSPMQEQQPISHDATSKNINLWEEMNAKVKPSINEHSLQEGDSVLSFSVEVKEPLSKNTEKSVFEKCDIEFCRSDGIWKVFQQTSTPRELPATIDLSASLISSGLTSGCKVDFRVVAQYKGGLVVRSEPEKIQLPGLGNFKPVVRDVVIKGVCRPILQVSWHQRFQQDIQVRSYTLKVQTGGQRDIMSKDFEVQDGEVEYCKLLHVPDLYAHDDVVVRVIARRDGDDLLSDPEDITKHCREYSTRCKRVFCLLGIVSLLLLAVVLLLLIIFVIWNLVSWQHLFTSAVSVTADVGVLAIGVQTGFGNFAMSFTGWDIKLCDSNQDDSLQVYCAAYNSSQLNSNRRSEYLSPDNTFIKLDGTYEPGSYTLPVSSPIPLYLVRSSVLYVYVCPPLVNSGCTSPHYKMDFYIFSNQEARDDFVNNDDTPDAYYKEEINFENGGACQNHSIPVNQSTLVYFAFSTAQEICFKELSAWITKRYYSASGLDLRTDQNKLKGTLFVQGDAGSQLACTEALYSEGLDKLCITRRVQFNFNSLGFGIPMFIVLCVCCVLHCCICTCICRIFLICKRRGNRNNRQRYSLVTEDFVHH